MIVKVKVSLENFRRDWSTKEIQFLFVFISSIHALCVILPLCPIPHLGMCDFGIPGIMGHLSRKWQRDGWLRLAVQARVTVCYGWALGQSQGSKCSFGRELTWLAFDRHWQAIWESFHKIFRLLIISLMSYFTCQEFTSPPVTVETNITCS